MNTRYQIQYLDTVGTQFMVVIMNMKGRVRSRTQARFLIKCSTSLVDRRPGILSGECPPWQL